MLQKKVQSFLSLNEIKLIENNKITIKTVSKQSVNSINKKQNNEIESQFLEKKQISNSDIIEKVKFKENDDEQVRNSLVYKELCLKNSALKEEFKEINKVKRLYINNISK